MDSKQENIAIPVGDKCFKQFAIIPNEASFILISSQSEVNGAIFTPRGSSEIMRSYSLSDKSAMQELEFCMLEFTCNFNAMSYILVLISIP